MTQTRVASERTSMSLWDHSTKQENWKNIFARVEKQGKQNMLCTKFAIVVIPGIESQIAVYGRYA